MEAICPFYHAILTAIGKGECKINDNFVSKNFSMNFHEYSVYVSIKVEGYFKRISISVVIPKENNYLFVLNLEFSFQLLGLMGFNFVAGTQTQLPSIYIHLGDFFN